MKLLLNRSYLYINIYFFFKYIYRNQLMPATAHPPIINIPPIGVVGPKMAFGPMFKDKQ